MDVILLEGIANLGKLGDKVSVKAGFARNFLLPKGKAQAATKQNMEAFVAKRIELEKLEAERLQKAQDRIDLLEQKTVVIQHKAGTEGKLFGSVSIHEITKVICENLTEVSKNEVKLPQGSIRTVGDHEIEILTHYGLSTTLTVKVEAIA